MSAHPEPIRPSTVGMPGRSAAEIRRDIDASAAAISADRSKRCAGGSPS